MSVKSSLRPHPLEAWIIHDAPRDGPPLPGSTIEGLRGVGLLLTTADSKTTSVSSSLSPVGSAWCGPNAARWVSTCHRNPERGSNDSSASPHVWLEATPRVHPGTLCT